MQETLKETNFIVARTALVRTPLSPVSVKYEKVRLHIWDRRLWITREEGENIQTLGIFCEPFEVEVFT
jgi:hypothetical protein